MVCHLAIQYFNLAFPYQQAYLQQARPFLMLGASSEAIKRLPDSTNNEKEEKKEVQAKQEEQDYVIRVIVQEEPVKTQNQIDGTLKKQQLSATILKPSPKRKRQLDSFTERRNILPNNINHILAFIQRKSKSERLVQRIIQKQKASESFTSKRYYCYQTYLKHKLHIHVNKDTLHMIASHLQLTESIFSVEEQLFYNSICRILICYYIRQMAKLKILSSNRVKCTLKLDHLKAHRTLLQYLVGNDDMQ